jgi:glycosyltransferase involved in cell wall biosynthesis
MISLIIPTRNRADLLDATLASIGNQTIGIKKFEIIVANNCSTDSTQEVIKKYKIKYPNLTSVEVSEPGLHNGRHAGMKIANGEILVFIDDDIEARPKWLECISNCFEEKEVALVGGNNYPMYLSCPPKWMLELWNKRSLNNYKAIFELSVIEFLNKPKRISPYLVWGCNFSIRKSVLIDAGGFHPDAMPKDKIHLRGDGETHVARYIHESGLHCRFHEDASIHHKITEERMQSKYFYSRAFNQGISDSYTSLREANRMLLKNDRISTNMLIKKIAIKLFSITESRELRSVRSQYRKGYMLGYKFHQKNYQNDPLLRNWVHRPNYF